MRRTGSPSGWRRRVRSRRPGAPIPRRLTRAGPGAGPAAARVTRIPAGHPEGYLEGFATIYTEVAHAIRAGRQGQRPDGEPLFPTVADGLHGVEFIEAAVKSSTNGAIWVRKEQP